MKCNKCGETISAFDAGLTIEGREVCEDCFNDG